MFASREAAVITKAKKNRRNLHNIKNEVFGTPNRTLDESPTGNPRSASQTELRDPLLAAGQLRRERINRNPHDEPNEFYGGTEISANSEPETGGGSAETCSPNQSPDPRRQHEKKGEEERKGLDREFGRI